LDPETPASALVINNQFKRMETPGNVPPVVNGFDENAVEAALRIRDAVGGTVTVLSAGAGFVMDVIKKTLSMGSDELVLVVDPAMEVADAFATAQVLAAAIRKSGDFDLILCGRQASDYDQALVAMGIAEILGIPAVSMAKRVEVQDGNVVVDRVLPDGQETVELPMPALVTVTNELGQPRYPNLAASWRPPGSSPPRGAWATWGWTPRLRRRRWRPWSSLSPRRTSCASTSRAMTTRIKAGTWPSSCGRRSSSRLAPLGHSITIQFEVR
jgi:electron transfer flavoprotein beta subunit